MKKNIALGLICCNLFLFARAQKNIELGFQAGININSAYGDGVADNVKDNMTGLHLGGHFKISMKQQFGLKAILAYDQNGWAYRNLTFSSGNGSGFETGDLLNRLNYLNLSMLAEQSFGNKIKFYLDGGIFTGYLLSNKMITKIKQPASRTYESGSGYRKSMNFGIVAGGGIQIPISAATKLLLGVQDNLGLSNIYKSQGTPGNATIKTNALIISAGITFVLK
jgi:hypothetical protein